MEFTEWYRDKFVTGFGEDSDLYYDFEECWEAAQKDAEPRITASEAVYGFAAWLTIQDFDLNIGVKQDKYNMLELIKKWLSVNDLPNPREGIYPGNIKPIID